MNLLTLDLGIETGIAIGNTALDKPEFFGWKLPMIGGRAARFATFATELSKLLKERQPDKVAIASPFHPQAQRDMDSARYAYYFTGAVEEFCYRRRIPIYQTDEDTVRMEVIGRCRWPKDQTKPAVLQFVRRELGIPVDSHHCADAVVLWMYHRQQMRGVPAGALWRNAG